MGEIQKADPSARRTALIIVGAGLVVGALLIAATERLRPMFEHWVAQDLKIRSWIVFAGITAATVGPVLAAAAYVWRLGQRVTWAERYPPPGVSVFRDTVVLTGSASKRKGRFMQVTAVTLGTAGILLTFFLWRVLFLLEAQ